MGVYTGGMLLRSMRTSLGSLLALSLFLVCSAPAAGAEETSAPAKPSGYKAAYQQYQLAMRARDLESAALHARRSYSQARYELGPKDPTTGVLAYNLGAVYLRLRRYRDAQSALVTAVGIYRDTHGEYAIDNLPPVRRLAQAYYALKAWEDSEKNFVRALAIVERHKGRDDPAATEILLELTAVAEARGEHQRMRNYGRRAVRQLEKSDDPPDNGGQEGENGEADDADERAIELGRLHIALARAEAALGDLRRSDQHLEYGLGMLEPRLAPNDRRLTDAYQFAVRLYQGAGKGSTARKYRRKLADVGVAVIEPDES
jgi:tetratricopeptide (TPR) repeat protein